MRLIFMSQRCTWRINKSHWERRTWKWIWFIWSWLRRWEQYV